jgi:DNA-binding NarL/FixJ family response regulator
MSPVRKTDPKIRERIVELLRDGWTPQRIADEAGLGVGLSTIQRIAKEEGKARKPGGARPGSGRPVGAKGGGRPKGSSKPDDRRAAVLALRGAGFTWAEIARQLHLKSTAHAQYLGRIPDGKE